MAGYPNDQGNPAAATPTYLVQDGTAVDSGNPLATTATFTGSISVGSVSLLAGTNDIGAVEQAGTWSVALNAGTNSIGSAVLGASTADIGNVGILTNAPDVVQVLTLNFGTLGSAGTLTLGNGQASATVFITPISAFMGGVLKASSPATGTPGLPVIGPMGSSPVLNTGGLITAPGEYQIGGVAALSEVIFEVATTSAAGGVTLTCESSIASPLDAQANFALSNLGNAITAPGTASLTAALTVQGTVATSGNAAITPVASSSLEATHVLKASAGTLYSVDVTNYGTLPGIVTVLNVASAPGTGSIAPLLSAPVAQNGGRVTIAPPSPATFSTGITVVLTAAATPFTYTAGITGFIEGQVT